MIDKKLKGGLTLKGAKATLKYLLNKRVSLGTARVLHGNEELTMSIIKEASKKFKWAWSSGVMSFEENLSDEVLREIAEKHREITFCGLAPDQCNSLYIVHSDKGRSEIHYIAPRMELSSGKSLNLYYVKRDFKKKDLYQDLINLEYGLSSPKASNKRELITQNKKKWATKKTTMRKEIDEAVLNLINAGDVQSRDDIIDFLRENDFEINRTGKESIFVLHDSIRRKDKDKTLDPIKLRGKIYGENFTDWGSLETSIREEDTPEKRGIEEVRRELDAIVRTQAEYNRKRYQSKQPNEHSKQNTDGRDLGGTGLEVGYSDSRGESNASEENQTKEQEPIRQNQGELDEHRVTAVIKRRREQSRRSREEFAERKRASLGRARELRTELPTEYAKNAEGLASTSGERLERARARANRIKQYADITRRAERTDYKTIAEATKQRAEQRGLREDFKRILQSLIGGLREIEQGLNERNHAIIEALKSKFKPDADNSIVDDAKARNKAGREKNKSQKATRLKKGG